MSPSEYANVRDISGPLNELCAALDLVPADIAQLVLTPSKVKVTRYLKNEDGAKYVGEDGEAAVEHFTRRVRT